MKTDSVAEMRGEARVWAVLGGLVLLKVAGGHPPDAVDGLAMLGVGVFLRLLVALVVPLASAGEMNRVLRRGVLLLAALVVFLAFTGEMAAGLGLEAAPLECR